MAPTPTSSTQVAKSGKTVQKKMNSGDKSKTKLRAPRHVQPTDRITRSQVRSTPLELELPSLLPKPTRQKLKPEVGSGQKNKSAETGKTTATTTTSIVSDTITSKAIRFGCYQRRSESSTGRKLIKKSPPVLVPITTESSSGEPGSTEQNPEVEQNCPFPLHDIHSRIIDNEGAAAEVGTGTDTTIDKTGDGNGNSCDTSSAFDLTALDDIDTGTLMDLITDCNNFNSAENNANSELGAQIYEELDQLDVCSAPGNPAIENDVEPTPANANEDEGEHTQMHTANEVTEEPEGNQIDMNIEVTEEPEGNQIDMNNKVAEEGESQIDMNNEVTEGPEGNQIDMNNEITDAGQNVEPKSKKPKKKKIVPAKPRANPIRRSVRAGVTLPVGQVHRQLRRATRSRLSADAPVFLTGVLEYLVHDIFTLAEEEMRKQKKKRITPKILDTVVRCDAECSEVWKSVMIPECGGGGVSKFSKSGQVGEKKKVR